MGDKYTEFAKKFSPSLYRRLKKAGVKNVDAAHDYMLRQLAFESGWGNSAVAKKYNNYAGWGHKVVDGKHVYSQFKDSEDFLDTWVPGMLGRYRSAIDAPTLNDYATNLKKRGYYEDSLEHYMQTLNGMGRATRAAAALRQSNPELYTDVEFGIPVRNFAMLNKPYVQPADNTRVVKPTQIQYDKTLPDTEVIGHRRKALQAPAIASLWDTLRQAIEYNLLKAAGMVPEDNNDDYTNMFIKPTLGLPHFAGGKDGWTPDQGWTVTRRGGKSYVSLGQPKEPTMKRPYWVTARTKQLDYDDLEKGYSAATAGMLPNYLTAARNFVQGDVQKGLVNLGMTADVQLTPDGTTYAVVAPGILDAEVNAARSFNEMLRRREDLQLTEEILRRDITGRHAEAMFRIFEQPRLYEAEADRELLEQGIDNILSNPTIQQRGVNPIDWDLDDMRNLREGLFQQSRWPNLAYRETLKDLYERWSGNSAEGVSLEHIWNYLNENVFGIHPRTADVPDVSPNTRLADQSTSGKPSEENLPEYLQNRPEIELSLPAGSKTFDYQMDSKSVLKNAKTTFDRMPSGAYYSLIKDGDLSTDSYTLLESLSRRWGDKVEIKIPRNPDGSVRMQKLNSLGTRRKLDDVKRAAQSLSRTTGVELPEVYSDGYRIFVPSFLLIKK